jgi:nucleoside-diphosphate-sugar epimerase
LQISPFSLEKRPWIRSILVDKRVNAGDIRDKEFIMRVIKDSKPDVLIHLTAIPGGKSEDVLAINYGSTLNILRAIEATGYLPKTIVYLSAILALGDSLRKGADEDLEAHPSTAYEMSKWLSEELIRDFSRENGLKYLIFRPVWIYGEYSINPDIPVLVRFVKRGIGVIPVSKNFMLGLIYAGDIAEAIYIGIIRGIGGTYNIRDVEDYTFSELIETLKALLGKRALTLTIPRWVIGLSSRWMDITRYFVLAPDEIPIDKWLDTTGYAPHTNLYVGLYRTVNWMFERGMI